MQPQTTSPTDANPETNAQTTYVDWCEDGIQVIYIECNDADIEAACI